MDHVTTERLMNDVQVVLGDAEQLLKQAAASSGKQADELRERANTALRRANLRMHEVQHAAAERTRAAGRAADSWVHEHPWTALGAGLGAGFLVGLLGGRR